MAKEERMLCEKIEIVNGNCLNCGAKSVKKNVKTSHRPSWIRKSRGSNSDEKEAGYDNGKNGLFSGNMMGKRIRDEML